MTSPPDDTTSDTSAIIAALRAERDAALAREAALAEALATRTAELGQRNTDYSERVEHQSATIDVLKAMSASPGDTQPVFDLIVRRARELCSGTSVGLFEYDGNLVWHRAGSGGDEATNQRFIAMFPMVPTRQLLSARAILDRQIVHVRDMDAEPGLFQAVRDAGTKSLLALPMLRDGAVIGSIVLNAVEAGGFSDSQIELLKTFAEQAVIATTSAETYRALQQRTADLQQSLEYQTATSDVLNVISRSTFDLQPVLDTLVETAARLCYADWAVIYNREDEAYQAAAVCSNSPEYNAAFRGRVMIPDRGNIAGRAVLEKRFVHVDDVTADPEYASTQAITLGGVRTGLGVPLLREGIVIGVIGLARQRVEPFTDRQIELVTIFADQAVIAIENTRLLTEQQEALEQQTATAEILQVINTSPGDLAPVFDAILEKAHRLCGAVFGALLTYDGEALHLMAERNLPPAWGDFLQGQFRPGPGHPVSRLIQGEPLIHIDDMAEIDGIRDDPMGRAAIDLGGIRTLLLVPLRKNDVFLGYITAYRQEVRPFTDRQIALLENFAAQAVIAMENARLLTEQHEALEQQTATAEVLQVINSSPGNLAPVFDAMLEKAMRLCGGTIGGISTYDGERFQPAALRGTTAAFAEYNEKYSRPVLIPGTAPARAIETRRSIQVPDITAGEPYRNGVPYARALVELGDIRAVLNTPLIKDNVVVGLITIYRREIGAFSDKQIALLENFGAQAVIAIENARLITEQREALEQQTATAEVLQVINASPGNLAPVFDSMLEKATRLCQAAFGIMWTYDGQRFHAAGLYGVSPAFSEFLRAPVEPVPGGTFEQLLAGEAIAEVIDIAASEIYRTGTSRLRRAFVDLGGAQTVLFVALRKDDVLLGAFSIYREQVGRFSEKQTALVTNFAAQAVIAMENARLITEQREALEQQTATAEVLQVINASPGDLQPVFDVILAKAHSLCDIAQGSLELYDGVHFRAVAVRGLSDAFADMLRLGYPASDNPATRPLIEGSRFSHIRDLAETDYSITQSSVELAAARTLLCVPLRRDETLLGMIASARREVRPFSEKEIALLENFAAQAVIAMENARLLGELRQRTHDLQESLEYQTATSDVLSVISRSGGELQSVLDTVVETATRICLSDGGLILRLNNGEYHIAASVGFSREFKEHHARRPTLPGRGTVTGRVAIERRVVHIEDAATDPEYSAAKSQQLGRTRTMLGVPLIRDDVATGVITLSRSRVEPFTDKQIQLVTTFADQAVIAIENARLFDELRQRQEELRVTFENMGDGVAMFGADLRLAAWNRNFQQILDLPDGLLAERPSSTDFVRYLATHGEYGVVDVEGEVQRVTAAVGAQWSTERTRPDGRVIELRNNPVPGGGFVVIYADVTERKRSEAEIRAARDAAEEASRTIEAAYRDLKAAQANLIQAEKMASLGQLTAGIAHEIKNPLNFVNNFAELSVDLLGELKNAIAPAEPALTEQQRAEIAEVSVMLTSNLEKITEHGKRADGIVKAMLEHSRGSSGERRMVDLNALIDEALNLAYHGARAQDQSFNITLERDFGEGIAPIEVNPQDITRVFLNLFSNGFYATTKRTRDGGDTGFVPTLKVTTIDAGEAVEIRVRDNGTGIPADIRDKLFQPFFTTKPTGEGTGLGLSITYDIVTQQHGGSIAVDSKVGEYSEFTIRLPRNP